MTNHANSNEPANHFLVFDTESVWDHAAYRRYLAIDKNPADQRWTTRQVVAASLLDFKIEGSDLTVNALKTICGADEGELIENLFREFAMRPDHLCVSWAGLAHDRPILELAAMRHHCKLPLALRKGERFGRQGDYRHLDLCQAMKGFRFAHLSEIAARLDLPAKSAGSAEHVERFANEGRWAEVASICEIDVISLGAILIAWLGAKGDTDQPLGNQFALLNQLVPKCAGSVFGPALMKARDKLRDSLVDRAWAAAA